MSEYQYYEFQAIDQPLSQDERKIINQLSSRAVVTSRQATFVYNYGDFRGNPELILAKYFDALFYITNWGTRKLQFRFPNHLFSLEAFKPYYVKNYITAEARDQFIILTLEKNDEEGGGWTEGEGILDELISLREDLLQGDFRCLYLAWLSLIPYEFEESTLEPVVPENLTELSEPLKEFITLFDIDTDLIAVAAENSTKKESLNECELSDNLHFLSASEKNEILLGLLYGETNLKLKLIKMLEEHVDNSSNTSSHKRRSVQELISELEKRKEDKKQSKLKAKQQARLQKLNELATREPRIWARVDELIQGKSTKFYEEAVQHLVNLKELAKHLNTTDVFKTKVIKIREKYSRYSALINKMRLNDLYY